MTRVQLRAGRITALLAILAMGAFASVAFVDGDCENINVIA